MPSPDGPTVLSELPDLVVNDCVDLASAEPANVVWSAAATELTAGMFVDLGVTEAGLVVSSFPGSGVGVRLDLDFG